VNTDASRAAEDSEHSEPDRPGESEAQRDDRNFIELLNELRVVGIGVQVLFGFLLGLPFTNRFSRVDTAQRGVYLTTVTLAALSTVLLVAPVAYHRLLFRRHEKESVVRITNVMAIAGLATVGLAVSGAVVLVVTFVAPGAPAIVITGLVVCAFAGLWFALPLSRRDRDDHEDPGGPAGRGQPPRPGRPEPAAPADALSERDTHG
jgi:O-antigen/teichoic acid export membrane protein